MYSRPLNNVGLNCMGPLICEFFFSINYSAVDLVSSNLLIGCSSTSDWVSAYARGQLKLWLELHLCRWLVPIALNIVQGSTIVIQ